jgi:CelD/BcsL family acetyltransferase involved in cellulose biosynthesis
MRRLEKLGRTEFREYETHSAVLAQLDAYRALEARSWKAKTGVGVARSEPYFAFYRDVAEAFARSGDFRVRMLALDDRVIAGTFGVVFDGVYYALQIAHDGAFDRYSPGTILEALEIERWFKAGYRRYEFLGGFLKNKARWTSSYRSTQQLQAYRRSLFLFLLHFVQCRVKPRVKDWIRPYMRSWRANRMEEV